jgi:hypothetical protein
MSIILPFAEKFAVEEVSGVLKALRKATIYKNVFLYFLINEMKHNA